MTADRRRASVVIGLALAFLIPVAAQAAGGQDAKQSLMTRAVAFVHTLAKGDFQGAETDFTDQMKQAAPPDKLRDVWQQVLTQVGPYQDTGDSKIVDEYGYMSVIVATRFKNQTLGIKVTFDSAQKIAGMHFVPAH